MNFSASASSSAARCSPASSAATVTYGYGAEGKHGANYMQTVAASVAGMSAMGVLIQAMVWLGLPQPPMWQLMLYFC